MPVKHITQIVILMLFYTAKNKIKYNFKSLKIKV